MSQTLPYMDKAATDDAVPANAHRLLWAGFMAILAAGVGFGVRGGILGTGLANTASRKHKLVK